MAESLRGKLVETRRDFFMHPELSGAEQRTAAVVAHRLRNLGLEVSTGVGGHGVIGLLKGAKDGSVVAWRADMDASRSDHVADTPYPSQIPGVAHVCGHDVHTTIGLGVAELLAAMQDQLAGSVKFIFQPAEETQEGARAIIEAGGLEDPRPEGIFGLHVAPLPVGQMGVKRGLFLSGTDAFTITLHGNKGAGSGIEFDALVTECVAAVDGLSTVSIPSTLEKIDALMAYLARGSHEAGDALWAWCARVDDRSDPNRAQLDGRFRASDEVIERANKSARLALDRLTKPVSVHHTWERHRIYPPTVNDPDLVAELAPSIKLAIGADNVIEWRAPWTYGADDFAYYQQQIPGVFFALGADNRAQGIVAMPHWPGFKVDEECLVVGTKAVAQLFFSYLDRRAEPTAAL